MTDWQKIETAPRDGTPLLVVDEYGIMTTAKWVQFGGTPGWWSLVEAGSYAADCEVWPTHWMPLPPAPTVLESE